MLSTTTKGVILTGGHAEFFIRFAFATQAVLDSAHVIAASGIATRLHLV